MGYIEDIRKDLEGMADPGYKAFHCKLIPTVDPDSVVGIRTPALRAYAKSLAGTDAAREFVAVLPHRYYEENNVHGLLLENIEDFDSAVAALDAFLPYVDNWATCDLMSIKAFKKYPAGLYENAARFARSDALYTSRFGIGVLMSCFLGDRFEPGALELVSKIQSPEYYVNMMRAWFFCEALVKQYDSAIAYLKEQALDRFTHNKSIQKAVESFRITPEKKDYLRSLKMR